MNQIEKDLLQEKQGLCAVFDSLFWSLLYSLFMVLQVVYITYFFVDTKVLNKCVSKIYWTSLPLYPPSYIFVMTVQVYSY